MRCFFAERAAQVAHLLANGAEHVFRPVLDRGTGFLGSVPGRLGNFARLPAFEHSWALWPAV